MDVNYLIQVLERKIIILNNAKSNAFAAGDLDTLNAVDQELLGVQSTLVQLNLLASVTQAAAASNSTTADLLTSAIQSSQGQSLTPSGPDIVNGYDISTYATDPSFEQNIDNILMAMPAFSSASDIDTYIQGIAPGSPVTGNMVVSAATTYNVDEPLLVALMQNDSQFGTQGVAVVTMNPGNVGNTGTATQTYASWQDGVSAVAAWLANHRAVVPDAPVPTAVAAITPAATTNDAATSTTAASVVTPAASTSTPDASIPVAASSTPAQSGDATSTAATSTPVISTVLATSTPPIAATSATATSTTDAGTSTPASIDITTSSSTPTTASSTPAAIPVNAASSTPDDDSSTSTSATSTSAGGN